MITEFVQSYEYCQNVTVLSICGITVCDCIIVNILLSYQYVVQQGLIVCVQVSEMLLELCVTELEDVASDAEYGRSTAHPVIQESPHPYTDDASLAGHVKIPGQEPFS
jgi:hypothetical protein